MKIWGLSRVFGSDTEPSGVAEAKPCERNSIQVGEWIDYELIEEKADETWLAVGANAFPIDPFLVAQRLDFTVRRVSFVDLTLAGQVSNQGGGVVIDVNGYDPLLRQRFTVAHEIGHALLHLVGLKGAFVDNGTTMYRATTFPLSDELTKPLAKSDPKEMAANRFAAALLMPREMLRIALTKSRDAAVLAAKFSVSVPAMQSRLNSLETANASVWRGR